MSKKNAVYKDIFKSTFLFGLVKIFNILFKIILNKVIAVFLGPSGVGIIGIYQSIINIFTNIGGLGVSQSAIKDISEVKDEEDTNELNLRINMINKIVNMTSFLGAGLMIVSAPFLSYFLFDGNKTMMMFLLSLPVAFMILTEGRLTILKSLRLLRVIAKSSIMGAFLGVFMSILCYVLLREKGIIPALIIFSVSTFLFHNFYVSKEVVKKDISLTEIIQKNVKMFKMGGVLMFTTSTTFLVEFIVRAYLLKVSGEEMVGFFQVGITILSGYFGVVITALITDYYPRISAVNKDNDLIAIELNKQVKVSFIILGPLVVLFLLAIKLIIISLYTERFLVSIDFIIYAIFGVLITIISNPLDMILIAKSQGRLFLKVILIYRVIHLLLFYLGFSFWGLKGLGISFTILCFIHFVIMYFINYKVNYIRLGKETFKIVFIIFGFCLVALTVNFINEIFTKLIFGAVIFTTSLLYSYYVMKKEMKIDVVRFIKNKIKKR